MTEKISNRVACGSQSR